MLVLNCNLYSFKTLHKMKFIDSKKKLEIFKKIYPETSPLLSR